jgi:hypothetical protein
MCNDCGRLHAELQKQSAEMYGLRKRITSLVGELKYERREKGKLIKEKKKGQKQHYKNGKRGTKFNG